MAFAVCDGHRPRPLSKRVREIREGYQWLSAMVAVGSLHVQRQSISESHDQEATSGEGLGLCALFWDLQRNWLTTL